MCGIVGYIGNKRCEPVLLKGLERLEYRGYDSCGIAVLNSSLEVYKDAVRVGVLSNKVPWLDGDIGIGHTRWATHGEPSKINAHPHLDCKGRIAVVHNGIITNYESLKQQLINEGHHFLSETDTEVLPHLIAKYYHGNLEEAVETALKQVCGSYAILVIVMGEAKMVAARNGSPLIIGIGNKEYFAASDVTALLDYTNRVLYLDDGDMAVMTREKIIIRRYGQEIPKEEHKVNWGVEDAQKNGYKHFMLKEIHEQPRVIRDTLDEFVMRLQTLPGLADFCHENGKLLMVACGTSYHAALVGKHIIEELTGISVIAESASEFLYRQNPTKMDVIGITQSGETADTLQAMKKVKLSGGGLLAITNVVGSSASRIADQVFFTRAGPEISVAATKTFIAQLVVLYCLALSNSRLSSGRKDDLLTMFKQLPGKIERVLGNQEGIKECAKYIAGYEKCFFVARGINLPIAMEGALKLKEISYIHAEGYSAGELKHGPFALLSPETPVIAIINQDNTHDAMLSNVKEIAARKSPIIALVDEYANSVNSELADYIIPVPSVDPLFSPFVNTVVMQLLAYYTANYRGCPIDFPRNLAKSVTVE